MAKEPPSRAKRAKVIKSKPYERPTSILRKVADTVCDLLPSWLNLQSWNRDGGNETVENVQNDSEGETDYLENELCQPGPSNVRCNPPAEASDISRFTRCPLPTRTTSADVQPLVNGDDQSDNSESSASTSGCSSLAPSHQEKKRLLRGLPVTEEALAQIKKSLTTANPVALGKRKKDASVFADLPDTSRGDNETARSSRTGSLWSEDEGLLLPKRPSRPQPSATGNKPSFRLSSFGAPVPVNGLSNFSGGLVSSPFYRGPTTFGGASALNTSRFSASRTSVPKVTIRERSSPDCMSSTAKRILSTLERMTTPLSDVKKIPTEKKNTVDFAMSFTPMSYRRRMQRDASKTRETSSFGPPVKNLGTPYPTSITRLPKPPTSVPVPGGAIFASTPILSQLPAGDALDSRKSGGKMMRPNKRSHYSAKADTEELAEEPALPSIPLPISSMPRFSFATATSTPAISSSPPTLSGDGTPTSKPLFSFASPIQHEGPTHLGTAVPRAPAIFQAQPFTFSAPVVVTAEKDAEKPISNCIPPVNFSIGTSVSFPKPPVIPSRKSDPENDKPSFGGLKAASELIIGGSVMDILGGKSKENTGFDQKTKEVPASAPVSSSTGFGEQFRPAAGNWTCGICLLSNSGQDLKCAACETPKSGGTNVPPQSLSVGFGKKFDPPAGNWSCNTCLVSNTSAAVKCIACETPKPGAAASTAVSATAANTPTSVGFGNKFAPPTNSWECETCLVRNKPDSTRCVACETLRLTTHKTTGVTETFTGFKFGNLSKSSSSSPATFKFGTTEIITSQNVTPANTSQPATFKFGFPSRDFGPAPGLGISFGSFGETAKTAANVSDGKFGLVTEIKFGMPPTASEEEKPSTSVFSDSGFASSKTDSTTGFTFGGLATSKPTPSSESGGILFGIPPKQQQPASVETPTFGSTAAETSTVPIVPVASPNVSTFAKTEPSVGGTAEAAKPVTSFQFGGPLPPKMTFSAAANIPEKVDPTRSEMKFGKRFSKESEVTGSQLPELSKADRPPSVPFAGFQAGSTNGNFSSTTATTTTTAAASMAFNFLAKTKAETAATPVAPVFTFGQGKVDSSSSGNGSKAFTFGGKSVVSVSTAGNTGSNFVFAPSGFSTPRQPEPSKMFGESKVPSDPSGFSFGAPATQKFDFVAAKSEPAAPAGGFAFSLGNSHTSGVGTSGTTPAFGGFSFGAPAPAQTTSSAFSGPSQSPLFGGFSSFGSGASPAFGQHASQVQQETPAFGSTAPSVPSFQFNPTAASDNSLFRFGAQQQQEPTQGGFTFGNAVPQLQQQPAAPGGFNFSASSGMPSFTFGAQQAPAQPSSTPFQFAPATDNIFNPGPGMGERRIRKAVRRYKK